MKLKRMELTYSVSFTGTLASGSTQLYSLEQDSGMSIPSPAKDTATMMRAFFSKNKRVEQWNYCFHFEIWVPFYLHEDEFLYSGRRILSSGFNIRGLWRICTPFQFWRCVELYTGEIKLAYRALPSDENKLTSYNARGLTLRGGGTSPSFIKPTLRQRAVHVTSSNMQLTRLKAVLFTESRSKLSSKYPPHNILNHYLSAGIVDVTRNRRTPFWTEGWGGCYEHEYCWKHFTMDKKENRFLHYYNNYATWWKFLKCKHKLNFFVYSILAKILTWFGSDFENTKFSFIFRCFEFLNLFRLFWANIVYYWVRNNVENVNLWLN